MAYHEDHITHSPIMMGELNKAFGGIVHRSPGLGIHPKEMDSRIVAACGDDASVPAPRGAVNTPAMVLVPLHHYRRIRGFVVGPTLINTFRRLK